MPKEKKRGFHHGDGGARRKRNGGDMHGLGCGADVVSFCTDAHARCSHESIIAQARYPCMADRIEEKGVLWRGGEGGRGRRGRMRGDKK